MSERVRKDIKLVVCDIDGTLTTTASEFTAVTKQAIEDLHANGIGFGIASGRGADQLVKVAKDKWGIQWPLDIVIGVNGAELLDNSTGELHTYYPLQCEWIKEIIELLEPFPHLNPFIYKNGMMVCKIEEDGVVASSKRNKMEFTVTDVSEFYAEPCGKLLVRVSEEEMEPLLDYFNNQHPSKYYHAFKTQTTMMEFMDWRVNKGVALVEYCKLKGLDINTVAAFGDIENDNELLKEAGLGVCMINGSDETKSYANDISDKSNDEDGVADYIYKYILSK